MKKFISAVLILLFSTTSLLSSDLKTYQDTYDKQMESIVLEHGAAITRLNASYAKSLNDLNEQATSAGDLDTMQAVIAEMKRFEAEETVPEEAKQDNSDINKIQQSYIQNLKNMELAKAKMVVFLASKYDAALDRLQVSLAKQSKIEEAVAVKNERENVAKSEDVVGAKKQVLVVASNSAKAESPNIRKTIEPKANKVLNSALTKDLLLHYTFDDFRGSKVDDESGTSNHGIVVGFPKKVVGVRGSAVALDGQSDMIVVQARKPNLTNVHQSDYTLALWFKPLSKPNKERGNGPSGLLIKAGSDVGLYYTTEEIFAMDVWFLVKANISATNPDGGSFVTTRSAPLVLDDEWVHVVGVVNESDKAIRLYLNGELVKETAWGHEWRLRLNGSPWRIGMADIGRCMTNGAFDDVRIYSRALASDEVQALYESTAPKQ